MKIKVEGRDLVCVNDMNKSVVLERVNGNWNDAAISSFLEGRKHNIEICGFTVKERGLLNSGNWKRRTYN